MLVAHTLRLGLASQEAARSLEAALEAQPDIAAAFNLVLCAFAGGDTDAARRAYTILLQVPATFVIGPLH